MEVKKRVVFFTRDFLPVMPLAVMEKFWPAPGGRYTAAMNHPDEADCMRAAYLEKRDLEKRQARFYRIMVTQTLFGPWALIREWGRIGSPGTVREAWYDSEQEALAEGEKLMKQKTQRGYRIIF